MALSPESPLWGVWEAELWEWGDLGAAAGSLLPLGMVWGI